jgi:transcriptional regulator with XRE-family HTH domain
MDLNENLRNNIGRLRKERSITQEVLAAALEISVQAVSKWETGASLPDIMQLPRIARFFGVSIDYLFYNEGKEQELVNGELPDDDILRIIQFRGRKMLGADIWEQDKAFQLKLPVGFNNGDASRQLNTEIWGNANIEGNIGGYVECNGGVNCGDIGGYVESNSGVNCGDIGGYVECGSGVNCGNIGGYVECGNGVNCGNVGAYIECGDGVNCGNVGGYIETSGEVSCGNVNGNVECGGDLTCGNISNQVVCQGNIRCIEIHGNVECEGNITYETTSRK